MGWAADPELLAWLSSPDNSPVRYLSARDLAEPRPAGPALEKLRAAGGWRTTSGSTTGTGGSAATWSGPTNRRLTSDPDDEGRM